MDSPSFLEVDEAVDCIENLQSTKIATAARYLYWEEDRVPMDIDQLYKLYCLSFASYS